MEKPSILLKKLRHPKNNDEFHETLTRILKYFKLTSVFRHSIDNFAYNTEYIPNRSSYGDYSCHNCGKCVHCFDNLSDSLPYRMVNYLLNKYSKRLEKIMLSNNCNLHNYANLLDLLEIYFNVAPLYYDNKYYELAVDTFHLSSSRKSKPETIFFDSFISCTIFHKYEPSCLEIKKETKERFIKIYCLYYDKYMNNYTNKIPTFVYHKFSPIEHYLKEKLKIIKIPIEIKSLITFYMVLTFVADLPISTYPGHYFGF